MCGRLQHCITPTGCMGGLQATSRQNTPMFEGGGVANLLNGDQGEAAVMHQHGLAVMLRNLLGSRQCPGQPLLQSSYDRCIARMRQPLTLGPTPHTHQCLSPLANASSAADMHIINAQCWQRNTHPQGAQAWQQTSRAACAAFSCACSLSRGSAGDVAVADWSADSASDSCADSSAIWRASPWRPSFSSCAMTHGKHAGANWNLNRTEKQWQAGLPAVLEAGPQPGHFWLSARKCMAMWSAAMSSGTRPTKPCVPGITHAPVGSRHALPARWWTPAHPPPPARGTDAGQRGQTLSRCCSSCSCCCRLFAAATDRGLPVPESTCCLKEVPRAAWPSARLRVAGGVSSPSGAAMQASLAAAHSPACSQPTSALLRGQACRDDDSVHACRESGQALHLGHPGTASQTVQLQRGAGLLMLTGLPCWCALMHAVCEDGAGRQGSSGRSAAETSCRFWPCAQAGLLAQTNGSNIRLSN